MATKKVEITIDYEELLNLIEVKYPEINRDSIIGDPFIDIEENGDFDRGTYRRNLKAIRFKLKE